MSEQNDPLDAITSEEVLRTSSGVKIDVSKEVQLSDQNVIWQMIQGGFTDLNRRSYESQSMTHEEFLADISSPEVLKFTASRKDETVGYMSVHIGLDHITWTDTSPLVEAQREVDELAVPFYIGTLVVRPNLRGREIASRLLQGSYIHFQHLNAESGQDSLCFFDCTDANYPQMGIFAQKAARSSHDFPGIDLSVIELHTDYWVQDKLENDKVEKLKTVPPDTNRYEVLDRQHYYAVRVATP